MTVAPPGIHMAADALCRLDFQAFVERVFHLLDPGKPLERAYYLDAMCFQLQRLAKGEIRRLIITVPPRHLKSITTAVAFPAWLMGHKPGARIVCASYGQELALTHARNFRKVIRSGDYAGVFPGTAGSFIRDAEAQPTTAQGGFRLAVSMGGTLTGLGADLLIVDDLMKASDAHSPTERLKGQRWFEETMVSRLDDKSDGKIVVIQQRLHEDDLVGFLLEKGGFVHLNLPAIAEQAMEHALSFDRTYRRPVGDILNPGREGAEVLEQLRGEMGSRAFAAQYQQNPTPSDSELIRWEKIQTYDEAPPRERMQCVVQSWDTALADHPRADYSVGTTWGYYDRFWHLLDVVRVRLPYPELLAKVRYERNRWRADAIIVEKTGTGVVLLHDLSSDMRGLSDREHHAPWCARFGAVPKISKEERLAAQVERLYAGKARFPVEAPWLEEFRRELVTFPGSKYDDQVDSVSQFLEWASDHRGRRMLGGDERPNPGPRPR